MQEDKTILDSFLTWFFIIILKIKAELSILLISFLTFVSPIKGLFLLVGVAVFIDTCAGVYIARKNNTFNSNNLFNIVVKTFFYMSTLILAYLIDKMVLNGKVFEIDYFSSKITAVFWLYIEGKSLDEKSQKLGNKPFTEIITNLIKWVKSVKKDINEIKE